MSYEQAEQAVIESVAPLGSEYQNILRKGLLRERWVDRYENKTNVPVLTQAAAMIVLLIF